MPVLLCQLVTIFLTLDRCPLSLDDRTKQIAEHVKHVHDASNSLPSSNSNSSQTYQHKRCYDYDPIRCRSTVAIALFAFVIVSHNNPHSPQIDTLPPPNARR